MSPPQTPMRVSPCYGQRAFEKLQRLWIIGKPSSPLLTSTVSPIPRTLPERLATTSSKTILYLAYGSNLSAETFKGTRGIKPISSVPIHCPTLDLTFSLSGLPYVEPCFANTAYRDPSAKPPNTPPKYHKDRWMKGLVGVVYEVTPEDYRTIIATEGGGASYQDVIVRCFEIPEGTKTIGTPIGEGFEAHTLLMPRSNSSSSLLAGNDSSNYERPDPSYAQPSTRYLKLITDGAEEHSLPPEYLSFLYNIRPYTITSYKQTAGKTLILAFFAPIIFALFGIGKAMADENGKIPGWLARLMALVFACLWRVYDAVFKDFFGDGERTMEKDEDEELGIRWSELEKRLVLDGIS
ncbi:hypothetical protein BGZ60DRAFT_416169 [Tricladium varicosporioides]|nr:hypothetical protein BGZ60DRAFT_416169 [Hymenoscyphus varicosporioides]